MKRPALGSLAVGLALAIAGCATLPALPAAVTVTSQTRTVVGAGRAKDGIEIGKSTRGDVAAALGETLVIRFDTGYEVWVYQVANDTGARGRSAPPARPTPVTEARADTSAELVILFAPSGIAAKTRIRPVAPD